MRFDLKIMKRGFVFCLVLVLFLSGCDLFADRVEPAGPGVGMKILYPRESDSLVEGAPFHARVEVVNGMKKDVDYTLCLHDFDAGETYGGIEGLPCIEKTISFRSGNLSNESEVISFPDRAEQGYVYSGLKLDEVYAGFVASLDYLVESDSLANICLVDPGKDLTNIECKTTGSISKKEFDSVNGPFGVSGVDYSFHESTQPGLVRVILDVDLTRYEQGGNGEEDLFSSGQAGFFEMDVVVEDVVFTCNKRQREPNFYRIRESSVAFNCQGIVDMHGQTYFDDGEIIVSLKYEYKLIETVEPVKITRSLLEGGNE